MKRFDYPRREEWSDLLQRPALDAAVLEKKVRKILDKVKQKGDRAVKAYTREFDGVKLKKLQVSEKEIKAAVATLDPALKEAIQLAAANIRKFHEHQLREPVWIETMPGVNCWRKSVAIESVGLYIPGGSAPLFSTILMLGIPAAIAGCSEIVLCSPPDKEGRLHPAILYTAQLVGVTKIFKCGGVQAIGAMAYGTDSIPKTAKIFGPGNQYVTSAKQLVQRDGVAIDMPAGPSEVAVFADETAEPDFVAADLLSQAEHGADSQVVLVTTSNAVADAVQAAVRKQVALLPRQTLAEKALDHSKLFLVKDAAQAMDLLNVYAPEHLILSCAHARSLAERVINAGSVFIGNYSPESVGDYASGTNHTLPTNGFARAYSGVSLDSFVKKITFQELSRDGLQQIGPSVVLMAEAEGLQAHAEAVRVRLR